MLDEKSVPVKGTRPRKTQNCNQKNTKSAGVLGWLVVWVDPFWCLDTVLKRSHHSSIFPWPETFTELTDFMLTLVVARGLKLDPHLWLKILKGKKRQHTRHCSWTRYVPKSRWARLGMSELSLFDAVAGGALWHWGARQFGTSRKGEESDPEGGQGWEEEGEIFDCDTSRWSREKEWKRQ